MIVDVAKIKCVHNGCDRHDGNYRNECNHYPNVLTCAVRADYVSNVVPSSEELLAQLDELERKLDNIIPENADAPIWERHSEAGIVDEEIPVDGGGSELTRKIYF